MKKLFVGQLSFSTAQEGLTELFQPYGPVTSVNIITDRETGRSRGFAFVELEDDAKAQEAISALNGQTVDGRQITVSEARPQGERREGGGGGAGRPFRSGGGGGGFGGGNRGGGGGGGGGRGFGGGGGGNRGGGGGSGRGDRGSRY